MEKVTSASDTTSSSDVQKPEAPLQAPNPSDVQSFNTLLLAGKVQDKGVLGNGIQKSEEKNVGNEEEKRSEKKGFNSAASSSASELQAQSFMAAFNQYLAPVTTGSSTENMPQSRVLHISTQIIDRILVSNAALNAKQEVHIKFTEAVLPGTEVAISKTDGVLQVAFRTQVVESGTFLTANQGDLKQHLMERLNLSTENVEVRVRSEGGSAAGGQASGDGRSRNRRYVLDEIEPEA